jgi:hypothetical protein
MEAGFSTVDGFRVVPASGKLMLGILLGLARGFGQDIQGVRHGSCGVPKFVTVIVPDSVSGR